MVDCFSLLPKIKLVPLKAILRGASAHIRLYSGRSGKEECWRERVEIIAMIVLGTWGCRRGRPDVRRELG